MMYRQRPTYKGIIPLGKISKGDFLAKCMWASQIIEPGN